MKTAYIFFFLCLFLITEIKAQQLFQERVYLTDGNRKYVNNSNPTHQGNFLLSGCYGVPSQGCRHLYLLVRPDTDTIWTRQNLLLTNGIQGVKQTPDKGFIAVGSILTTPTGPTSMILQKRGPQGFPSWQKIYNGPSNGVALLMAPDSGYFLMGVTNLTPANWFLTRTDSLGNIKWQKNMTWAQNDYNIDLQYTHNGNIVISGTTNDYYPWKLKLLLINQNGDSLMGRAIDVTNPPRHVGMWQGYQSVTPLTDGGFLVTVEVDSLSGSIRMGMVAKVDANLQPVWHYINRTPNLKNKAFSKAKELADGSVIVLSSGFSLDVTDQFQLFRFSSTGTLLNTYTFTTGVSYTINTNTLDYLPADSSFLIGGEATVSPWPNFIGGIYVAKVKIAGLPPAVITSTPKPVPLQPGPLLGQSYPNPTTAEATIPYRLPKGSRTASIVLHEVVTGRKVKSYELPAGKTEGSLTVDVSKLSNGLYIYSLVADGKPVATKKLAVMK